MKRLLALALGITVLAGVGIAPASAGQFVGQPSVFPVVRDPWASWGRQHRHETIVSVPGVAVTPGFVGAPVVQPLWYPGQWAWTGYEWVWVPGHWVY